MDNLLHPDSSSFNVFDMRLSEGIELIISKLIEKNVVFDADLSAALKQAALMVCIPVSKEFNPLDKNQRIQDQVGYGFPFISIKYPWPVDSEDRPKQPVIQIDLVNASQKLNFDFGEGLVQIWMSAYTEGLDPELELRIIKNDDLQDELLDGYPSEAPWLKVGGSFDFSRFNCDFLSSPLINWKQIGYLLPEDPVQLAKAKNFSSIRKLLKNPKAKNIYYECLDIINKEFKIHIKASGTLELMLLGGHTFEWGDNYMYCHEIERPDTTPANSTKSRLLFHVQYDNGIGSSGIYLIAGGDDLYCDIYERYNI